MRVRALKTFSAYVGSQIIPVTSGEEIEGDLALALVQACCAVEVVDDPNGALAEAAEFHAAPAAVEAAVQDPEQIGEPPAPAEPEPTAPRPTATKVRALSTFSAYDGENVVQIVDGQEIEGPLAAILADADCDVEVLETETPTAEPVVQETPEPVQTGPVPAGDSPDDPAADFVPGPHTVKDVLAYVEAHPDQAEAVLAAERADRARTTLLDGLADFIASRA